MILTDDDELAETATELRRLSGRMEEINALIAMHSIEGYADDSTNHDVIYKYCEHIAVPYKTQLIPTETNNSVYSILFEEPCVRNAVMTALARNGVETKVYYDPLVSGLPNTDYVYQRILSLPIHKDVIPVQDEIIKIINAAAKSAKTPGKEYLTK
jgi:dTDP-4-amino-4,6-dideoxygalactose transaminase